jgi:hypothetical protein
VGVVVFVNKNNVLCVLANCTMLKLFHGYLFNALCLKFESCSEVISIICEGT